MKASVAKSVEHRTTNIKIVGSSPTLGNKFFILSFVAFDALLTDRLVPYKWNQASQDERPS